MATETTNTRITIPAVGDAGPGYATVLKAALDAFDALAPVGRLAVATAETPSTTLNIRVASGTFRATDGSLVSYAGTSSFALTASSTNSVYLSNSGTLTKATSGYPAATDLVRLATVVTGTTTVTSVVDDRAPFQSFGGAAIGGVTVQEEGTPLATAGTTLNFVGSGVTASGTGATKTITVSAGDASTNTATSVDSEVALFSSTTGKLLKRATGSGLAKLTSGVLSIGAAGTDYLSPSGSGASLTALNATQLTTGTVATARLGTGTANSTTYLRGDGTWTSPSGSGDVVGPASAVDSEGVVFDGTTGKLVKRATGTGFALLTSGVLSATTNGSTLTTLNASNLSSGTVATARLGSGTADGTTVLYGNGTWAAPTAGITVQDEGSPLTTAGTTLNFVGSGVTASGAGATKTITIAGGGVTTAGWTMDDPANIALGGTTGTKIGTSTTQKLGFFNATPVVQPSGGSEIVQSLVNLGLRAATGSPDLTINDGALTCGQITIQNGWNVVVGSATGTKFGTATTQKIGFFNKTPVIQPASANQAALTDSSGGTPSTTIAAISDTATKNAVASLALLLNQIRSDLVALGLLKGSA